ncbi:HD-GYP domain-containing protein [Yunchengibacter salinarum]|uniref:HD-GYP domain-containing protein n=1 Tax=Yunchengibacter salinarum TaxID=3133399 RepID=UPI0035B5931A
MTDSGKTAQARHDTPSRSTRVTEGRRRGLVALGAVVLFLAFGGWLILSFAEDQRQSDLKSWRDRLNLVAESRADAAGAWLNRHLSTIEGLAGDASLQLYATHALNDSAGAEAQRGYIFSLISAEADRGGFHEDRATDQVKANVARPQRAGIALVTGEGTPLVATSGMPEIPADSWPRTTSGFITLGPVMPDGTPLVLFGAPLGANEGTPGNGNESARRAWVIGARPLGARFRETLVQPGSLSSTAETYVVMRKSGDGSKVRAITRLDGGGRLGEAQTDPAAAFAVETPGGFATRKNYEGDDVLVTGRTLPAPVPWVLVRTIDASEALAHIDSRRNSLIITLGLAGLVVLGALVLVWRTAVSRRLMTALGQQAAERERADSLSKFLQAVSDAQPTAIAAVDETMTVRFANRGMGDLTGFTPEELQNRRLSNAFERDLAITLKSAVQTAAGGRRVEDRISLPHENGNRRLRAHALPLEKSFGHEASALIVMEDITDLITANERSERLLHQVVATLTRIIDSRDPWSRDHSNRVAIVARAIAGELSWRAGAADTVATAGQLVNLGKIFVPRDLLVKESPLSEDELHHVRDCMQKGAELVTGIDFPGPVARALAELHERWDGSGGPNGLSGEAIAPEARVLAVANAFVGMVSARAHRTGMSFDDALDTLGQQAGQTFERRVVAALQNVLENRGGRDRWADFTLPHASHNTDSPDD